MIDMHSHILPGLDDGAAHEEDALEMARGAVSDGITTVIATPHHANGRYLNDRESVLQAVIEMNRVLEREGIPLDVVPGQEIRIYDDLIHELEQGRLCCLHESRYILLEFPSSRVPDGVEDLFHELIVRGLVPVIAHPERNAELARQPSRLMELIEWGALSQVTSHSLTGGFGKAIQKTAMQFCKQQWVHFIASDAHHPIHRPFRLREAYAVVERELGADQARYFQRNAESILNGEAILPREVLPLKSKWYEIWKK